MKNKFGLMLVGAVFAGSQAFATPVSNITVTFTGTCQFDCTGTGTGTLVLLGTYVYGSSIAGNVVSFTYQSDYLGTVVFLPTDNGFFASGSVGPTFPAAYDVAIMKTNANFASDASGPWCVVRALQSCFHLDEDFGNPSLYNIAAAPPGVPEPASVGMIALGMAGLAFARRLRKS